MAITLQIPDGMFSDESQATLAFCATEALQRIDGTRSHVFAARHLTCDIRITPPGKSFAAGVAAHVINLTVFGPRSSLDSPQKQRQFVTEMTDVIEEAAGGNIARDRIYINMVYGDGFFGIDGRAHHTAFLRDQVRTCCG